MSTPFLADAFVRSALTRMIAALETSTRRNPSQKQVNQLNDLRRIYHGILTSKMTPETALGVLSKIAPPSPLDAFEKFDQKCNQLFNMLSTVMKNEKEMQSAISRNLI
jgi:hypothetical protein